MLAMPDSVGPRGHFVPHRQHGWLLRYGTGKRLKLLRFCDGVMTATEKVAF
jgi:hypothetical protein